MELKSRISKRFFTGSRFGRERTDGDWVADVFRPESSFPSTLKIPVPEDFAIWSPTVSVEPPNNNFRYPLLRIASLVVRYELIRTSPFGSSRSWTTLMARVNIVFLLARLHIVRASSLLLKSPPGAVHNRGLVWHHGKLIFAFR